MSHYAPMSYAAHCETQTFNDLLVEQLKSTPWVVASLAFHVAIAIILSFMGTIGRQIEEIPVIHAQAAVPPEEELKPEVPEDIPEDITPQEVPADDPSPVDIDDKKVELETEQDEDEVATGEDFDDDVEDLNKNTMTIGFGPGGGGAFGRGNGGNDNHGRCRTPGSFQKPLAQGLEWLARHQSADGRWDCDGYMRHGDPSKGALCTGKGSAMYDVGVTGLALLSYLGAGHTHREGEYRATVREGLKWLKGQQDAEGCFGSRGDPHFTYNHAVAALAMAEAYGMTKSGLWKSPAQRGIDFVMSSQNPYKAWRYGVRPGDNDTSVSGWMVMALKSAKLSGLDVNDTALQWAKDFVVEMTDEDTGRVGYTKRGERPVRAEGRLEAFPADHSEALTAVGVLTRIFAGEDPRKSAAIKAGAQLMSRRLPVWEPRTGKVDMYYWYYASLALFQCGGSEWTAWSNKMKSSMVDSQRKDGNFAGSWDPVGPWGEDGGRVYSTAVMTLCMEVYFRYPRVFGVRGK